MGACLRQIGRKNPIVNAIVTLVPEDHLLSQAKAADDAIARIGRPWGRSTASPLGLKTAIKQEASALHSARLCSRTTCPILTA